MRIDMWLVFQPVSSRGPLDSDELAGTTIGITSQSRRQSRREANRRVELGP
jgi:hypothetical protein